MTKIEISRRYSGRLVVVSPLHVGSGEFAPRSAVKGKAGANQTPLVSLIARDGKDDPFIPGTTLKGLLVRLVAENERSRLAGEIREDKDSPGQAGAVLVRGARLVSPGKTEALPYNKSTADDHVGRGVFIAARTSVDGAMGTVKDTTLFFQEMVAPGSVFEFECVVAPRGWSKADDPSHAVEARVADVSALLEKALGVLSGKAGAQIGKGQADGLGAIRIEGDVTATSRFVDGETGEVTDGKPRVASLTKAVTAATDASSRFSVAFECDGPFLIADASRKKEHIAYAFDEIDEKKANDKEPHVRPQKQGTGKLPLILGTSLSGALRDRAEWLASVHGVGAGEKRRTDISQGLPIHPIDRLFGMTGFRGLLGIRSLEVRKGTLWPVTSVKIDRFSGAPYDSGLFKTETFVDVAFDVCFEVERRGYVPKGTSENDAEYETARLRAMEDRLLDLLKADLAENGLEIGAGGNKGFGWFTAKVEEGGHNG